MDNGQRRSHPRHAQQHQRIAPMYQHCTFCSSGLSANDSIEHFPVGRTVAFDPWKGRLWAVCRHCQRWNLAPIEERWEAVEEAERHFVDSRLRVHSENIGLARLPDRTRLIRVGKALPRGGGDRRHRRCAAERTGAMRGAAARRLEGPPRTRCGAGRTGDVMARWRGG